MKDSRAPCPALASMRSAPILVSRAHESSCIFEKPCQCPQPVEDGRKRPYGPPHSAEIGALWSPFRPAPEPMRQNLPQHAPLDRLVGGGRVMPPEAVALHRLRRRHEPVHDRREIRVRVV